MPMSCPPIILVLNDGNMHDPAASLVASHTYLGYRLHGPITTQHEPSSNNSQMYHRHFAKKILNGTRLLATSISVLLPSTTSMQISRNVLFRNLGSNKTMRFVLPSREATWIVHNLALV